MEKKTMQVALFEIKDNFERWQYLKEITDFTVFNKESSYIRISDIHTIEFELVSDAEIIPEKVKALRETRNAISAEMHKKLAQVDEKIQKLQALPFIPVDDQEPLTEGPVEGIEEGS